MSMVSHLNQEYMEAQCPCCGRTCTVWESDLYGTLMDGKDNTTKEYSGECPECHQQFYASIAY